MDKKSLKILGGVAAVFIAAVAYFFIKGPSLPESSLTGLKNGLSEVTYGQPQQPAANSEMVRILNMLNGIKLDTDIFNNPAFLSLEDFSVGLPEARLGKSNPFSKSEGQASGQTSSFFAGN